MKSLSTRQLDSVIVLLAASISLWNVFYPKPYYWAIGTALAFLPFTLLIACLFKFHFKLTDEKNDGPLYTATIDLYVPLSFVGFSVMLRTYKDLHPVSGTIIDPHFLVPVTAIVFFITTLIHLCTKKTRFSIVLFSSFCYACPIVLFANHLGPAMNQYPIEGVISGKYVMEKSRERIIILQAYGEQSYISVSPAEYDGYAIGKPGCAIKKKGWLGLTMIYPVPCHHAMSP